MIGKMGSSLYAVFALVLASATALTEQEGESELLKSSLIIIYTHCIVYLHRSQAGTVFKYFF